MPSIKINKLVSIESNPSNTILETMEQRAYYLNTIAVTDTVVHVAVNWNQVTWSMLVLQWRILSQTKFCLVFAKRNPKFRSVV